MGLYTRFGGAVCRMLRRWVEGGIPSISGRPVDRKSPKKTESKKSKKAEYKKTGDDDDEDTVVITNIDCFKIGDHGQKSQPKDKSTKSEKIKSIQKDLVKAIKDKGFLITAMNPPFDPNDETLTAENFPEGIYDPYEDEKEARRSNEAKSEDLEYTGVKEAEEERSKSKGQSGFIDWLEGIAGNIQQYNYQVKGVTEKVRMERVRVANLRIMRMRLKCQQRKMKVPKRVLQVVKIKKRN